MTDLFRIEDGIPWVGDRSFPWAKWIREDDLGGIGEGYEWHHRGFHLLLENGWTLSVQWGSGNYCVNYPGFDSEKPLSPESPTAEIAAWDHADHWWEFDESDGVLGWQTTDDVLRWIDHFAAQPSAGRAVGVGFALGAASTRMPATVLVDTTPTTTPTATTTTSVPGSVRTRVDGGCMTTGAAEAAASKGKLQPDASCVAPPRQAATPVEATP